MPIVKKIKKSNTDLFITHLDSSDLCSIIIKNKQMEIDEKKFDTVVLSVLGKLDEILSCVKARNILNGERLYDNQDLCLMLKLSKRSLQRYRSLGVLKYIQVGQKTLYYESDVKQFIKEHLTKDNTGRNDFQD